MTHTPPSALLLLLLPQDYFIPNLENLNWIHQFKELRRAGIATASTISPASIYLSSPPAVKSMAFTSDWVAKSSQRNSEGLSTKTGNAAVPSNLFFCGHTHQIWPKSEDKKLRNQLDLINARGGINSNVAKSRIPCATHFIETIIEETLSGELNKGLQESVILSKRRSRMASKKVLVTTGTNNRDCENDLGLVTMSSITTSSKMTLFSDATNSGIGSDKAQNEVIGSENKPRASEIQNTSTKGLYESFFFLKSRNPTNSTQSIMSMVPKKAHDVSSERNLEVASLKSAVASSSDSGNPAVVHNKASILKYQEFVCPVMTFVSLVMDKTTYFSDLMFKTMPQTPGRLKGLHFLEGTAGEV
ncbi:hypothetical protein L5515_003374 [Caenorhabditis briggsae]|uniref:Uncharacterized protein n=1 Tax=Caenorhabditis briggsae TaxID=6238 RepID=A0AAE9JAB5_CAEBR|nr:hypothetical protein L5515_003374 [Caenorhabditis briggsae]